MMRILKIVSGSLAALLLILSSFAWWLLNDETFLKQQTNKLVRELSGLDLKFEGSLELTLGTITTVTAGDVHLSNAEWADSDDMLRVGKLTVQLMSMSIFSDQIDIQNIEIVDLELKLEQNDRGEKNWDILPASTDDSGIQGLPVWIDRLQLDGVEVSYTTPSREVPLDIRIDTALFEQQENEQLILSVIGAVNGLPYEVSGDAGPLSALIAGGDFSHQLAIKWDEISFNSSVSMEDGSSFSGLYLDVDFQGPDFTPITELMGLPKISGDPFAMKLVLDARQGTTQLDLTGNLGGLEVSANGHVEDLLNPSEAQLKLKVSGPDLNNLAQTFGISILPASPYQLTLDLDRVLDPTLINSMTVTLGADQIALQGELGARPEFFNSSLNFNMSGPDLARWSSMLRLQILEVAPFTLVGTIGNGDQGALTTTAQLSFAGNDLAIEGPIGLPPRFKDVEFGFNLQSSELEKLARLFGFEGLPITPIEAQGLARWSDEGINLNQVKLLLQDSSATIDGLISLGNEFKSSHLQARLNIPSAANLGELLGWSSLPDQVLAINGNAKLAGDGLEFEVEDGSLGAIQFALKGRMPQMGSVAGIEADFSVSLPSLEMASFLVEELELPNLPFDASGHMRSEAGLTRFTDVQIGLGDSSFRIDGGLSAHESLVGSFVSLDASGPNLAEILDLPELQSLPQDFSVRGQWQIADSGYVISDLQLDLGSLSATIDGSVDDLLTPPRFALNIQAGGPDVSVLNELLGRSLDSEAFNLTTRFEGSVQSFDLKNLQAQLGAYSVSGELNIVLAEPAGITGQLNTEFLDVSPWIPWSSVADPAQRERISAVASDFVFTDKPLPRIDEDLMPIDVDVSIDELLLGELTLRNIHIGVFTNDRLLRLNPLQAEDIHGGTLNGSIELDANATIPELVAKIRTENFRLGLIGVQGRSQDTEPPADLFLDISGSGSTYRQMASSLNGRIRLQLGEGQIANIDRYALISDVIKQLISALNPFAEGRTYTNLDCAIVAADIVSGNAKLDPMIVQTENVTILSDGAIDLNTESIDLAFNSRMRTGVGINVGMVVNPFIKLGGQMRAPKLELDSSGAVVLGGVAVATGGFSLLARSAFDRYLRDNDPCGTAVEELIIRDTGPQ